MNNTSETDRKDNTKKIILVRFIVSTVVVLALLLAISYAWFTDEADMATLIEVNSPSQVSVLGPHGQDMESIDMSYTDSDKDGDRVTIRRVISVSNSADSHQLEIAHTTNLRNLTFTLYKATELGKADSDTGTETRDANTVVDKGYKYTYSDADKINGSYINLKDKSGNYKFADETKHSVNFDTNNVQAHAEPIYWLSSGDLTSDANNGNGNVKTKNLTYYVVEISWDETTKETDIFYIFAQNN